MNVLHFYVMGKMQSEMPVKCKIVNILLHHLFQKKHSKNYGHIIPNSNVHDFIPHYLRCCRKSSKCPTCPHSSVRLLLSGLLLPPAVSCR